MTRIIFSVTPHHGQRTRQTASGYPVPLLSEPAIDFDGKPLDHVRVAAPRDEFFGGENSKPFLSRPLVNPTWGDLKRVAGQAARATGDRHHVFLEGVYRTGEMHEDGSELVHLFMGS